MKIIDELTAIQKSMALELPEDILKTLTISLSDMLTQNLDAHALKKEDIAPDFFLQSTENSNINLYKLLDSKPVIISFFRGSWCPFCVQELKHFQNNLKLIKQTKDLHFVAISPQSAAISCKLKQDNTLDLTILEDCGNQTAKQYGFSIYLT